MLFEEDEALMSAVLEVLRLARYIFVSLLKLLDCVICLFSLQLIFSLPADSLLRALRDITPSNVHYTLPDTVGLA
jgi:hypothetical protein